MGLLAKSQARLGRLDEARPLAAEAVRLAAATDYLDLHAYALLNQAEVLRLAGEQAEAASAVREARDLFARKGNVVAEGWAAELADEIESSAG